MDFAKSAPVRCVVGNDARVEFADPAKANSTEMHSKGYLNDQNGVTYEGTRRMKMVPIIELWLPILLSAVIVFIASSILHMVLTYHRSDYQKFANEDTLREVVGKASPQPGFYAFPHCMGPKEMKSPEMMEKYTKGPVGYLTIIPNGAPAMGKLLTLWFLYCVLVGVFVAYLTGRTMGVGTHYLAVFRVAGTIAFLGYGVGNIVDSIWKGQPWSTTWKHVIDGFIYGLLTAGTFGWLWPR
jgi:hypothetical protein